MMKLMKTLASIEIVIGLIIAIFGLINESPTTNNLWFMVGLGIVYGGMFTFGAGLFFSIVEERVPNKN